MKPTMMNPWTRMGAAFALLAALLTASSCSKRRAGGDPDTNTNWLRLCDTTSECGDGLECLCGACNVACEASSECQDLARGAVCVPTHSCESAQAVCAEAAQTQADLRSTTTTSEGAPPGGGTSDPLCHRAVEEYTVSGQCSGVNVACATDEVYFEDACGCGCEPAAMARNPGAGGAGSGGDGSGNNGGNGVGAAPSMGSSSSIGGGDPGQTGGASGSLQSRTFASIGGAPVTGVSGPQQEVGGAGPVPCDGPERVYISEDAEVCAETEISCESYSGFFDECGCGCWNGRPFEPYPCDEPTRDFVSTEYPACQAEEITCAGEPFADSCGCGCFRPCDHASRYPVSRDGFECIEADLACGDLPAFDDPCGCGCIVESAEDTRLTQLPLVPADCPPPPEGDDVATRSFDLASFGCDDLSGLAAEGLPETITSDAAFEVLLETCGAAATSSGIDFDESTLVLAVVETTPEARFSYAVRDSASSVVVGIEAYQWCSQGDPPYGVVARVVDVPNATVTQRVCELMPCISAAP